MGWWAAATLTLNCQKVQNKGGQDLSWRWWPQTILSTNLLEVMLLHWSKKIEKHTNLKNSRWRWWGGQGMWHIKSANPPQLPFLLVSAELGDNATSRLLTTCMTLISTLQVRPLNQRCISRPWNRFLLHCEIEASPWPGFATPLRRKGLRQTHGRLLLRPNARSKLWFRIIRKSTNWAEKPRRDWRCKCSRLIQGCVQFWCLKRNQWGWNPSLLQSQQQLGRERNNPHTPVPAESGLMMTPFPWTQDKCGNKQQTVITSDHKPHPPCYAIPSATLANNICHINHINHIKLSNGNTTSHSGNNTCQTITATHKMAITSANNEWWQ